MKLLYKCEKDRSCCEECIKNSKATEQQKALHLALLDIPGGGCNFYEEEEIDLQRHREVEEFLRETHKSEEEAKNCKLVFK